MLSPYLYNLCRFSLLAMPPPKKERLIVGHCFAERSFVVASDQFHRGLNDVTSFQVSVAKWRLTMLLSTFKRNLLGSDGL